MTIQPLSTVKNAADNPVFTAILLTCLAYLLYSFSDTTIKYLGSHYHFTQIVFFNGLLVASGVLLYGWWREGKTVFRMQKPKWVILRALLGVTVSSINMVAVAHLQLTTFYTLVFTSPLWVAMLSAMFLKEKISNIQAIAVVLGFAVIVVVFQPGSGMLNGYGVLTLLSSCIYGFSVIVMRHLGPKESRTMIIATGSIAGVILMFPFMLAHFRMPTLFDAGIFVLMGIFGALGVAAITRAFQIAPSASSIAPYHYTQIIWGAGLGYLVFGDVPSMRVVFGAFAIVVIGLFLLYGEARNKKATRKKLEALSLAEIGEPAAKTAVKEIA